MLLWLVRKQNTDTGFTLMEILITVIVVGVIGAIAAPNLLGLLNRYRVDSALDEVEGAIKEAQRQAMRDGQSCTITIDTTDNDNAIAGGCLLRTRSLDDLIRFNSNAAIVTFTFSGKGNTNDSAVLVVSMSSGTERQKCLVMSPGLGLIRTGDYSGDPTGTLLDTNCQ